MGMDVIGRKPTKSTGEYFRNNVWWWHPLWEYCENVAPEICDGILGHSNDGDGLPGDGARKLAEVLQRELEGGRTAEYAAAYLAEKAALPRHDCDLCDATGIRSDTVGTELGMPTRTLDAQQAERLGRTHGWCNACNGEGTQASWESSYFFDVDNVREFATFLEHSGGFRIH